MKCPSSLSLIEDLGEDLLKTSNTTLGDYIEFARRSVYDGKPNEDLVTTRVRLYNTQSIKKISSLPPDLNSLRQDILRKHHQACTWGRCTETIIS